jgi:ATP-binding cassette subfamily B multidrug efflux pump
MLLAPIVRLYRVRLLLGFVALLGVDLFQLLIPRLIKNAVDELDSAMAIESDLLKVAGLILLLALAIAICRFFWRYLVIGFSRLLERDLRNLLFKHILKLDRFFFQRHTTGEMMALSSNDLSAVQLACGMGMIAFADAVVMTCAVLGFMIYISPLLTFIAVSPMPFLAVLTRVLSARLHKRFRKVQEQFEKLTEFARSTIANIRLIKAYTQEIAQTEHFDRLGRVYIRDNLKVATVQGILYPVSGLVANSGLLLVLFFGGRLTIHDTITIGDFVAFVSYLFMLTWPMMALGWVTNLFQRGATSLSRIHSILLEKPALKDKGRKILPKPVRGYIRINHLSFQYRGRSGFSLEDVSLNIKPGITGIIGKTGSGKTTLCNILTRLYPIPDSTVFMDEIDVNTLSMSSVRGLMAYVPQEGILFSDTIRANIALGYPEATMSRIEEVAKAAAVHDEIIAMTRGYDTRIGERGVKLSGGQRQRIALARALLLDRPFMIIDDGLSAVDMETEHTIINALASYLQNKTCIIVSHRIAPLINAAEIVVMDRGRIASQGNHQLLLDTNEYYAIIYRQQTLAQKRSR